MVLKTSVFLIFHFAYFIVFYIIKSYIFHFPFSSIFISFLFPSFFRLINLYNHFYIYSPAICLYIHFLNMY
jgi:hypothetical protein